MSNDYKFFLEKLREATAAGCQWAVGEDEGRISAVNADTGYKADNPIQPLAAIVKQAGVVTTSAEGYREFFQLSSGQLMVVCQAMSKYASRHNFAGNIPAAELRIQIDQVLKGVGDRTERKSHPAASPDGSNAVTELVACLMGCEEILSKIPSGLHLSSVAVIERARKLIGKYGPAQAAPKALAAASPGARVAKYRKKPVVVEAVQWDGAYATLDGPLRELVGGLLPTNGSQLAIHTLEGDMMANTGDWIIKGTRNELYPCKPGPFADTFELVE